MRRVMMALVAVWWLGASLSGQDLKTDFTGPVDEPLVTVGAYTLRGTVLVQYDGSEADVVIPVGLGVTEIADNAFFQQYITSVTIPEGVRSIGRAFVDCYSLASVAIPASLTAIAEGAFNGCRHLAAIVVAGRNPAYTSESGVLFDKRKVTLLRYCAGRPGAEYVVPAGVTRIADYAFADSMLSRIVLPGGLGSIGVGAFADCRKLTGMTIPGGVTVIRNSAFYYCTSLASVALPEGITAIEDRAFLSCGRLTGITIPASVTAIGEWAFGFCNGLSSISIPLGVTSIGDDAFVYCRGLKEIRLARGSPLDRSRFPRGIAIIETGPGAQGTTIEGLMDSILGGR